MSNSFNIANATTEELRDRLTQLREDRKTYGTPRRSVKKKAVPAMSEEEKALQELFGNLPPEVQEKIASQLLEGIDGEDNAG